MIFTGSRFSAKSLSLKNSHNLPQKNILLPALIILIIFLLNLIWLKSYPFVAIDEGSETSRAFSLFDYSKNITKVGSDFVDKLLNTGQLMLPLLLRISFALGGVSILSGRLVPLLLGVILLFLTYFLTKYLHDSKAAIFSLLLLAFSETFFFSSHLIRGDIALAVMVLLAFLLLIKGIMENKNIFLFLSGLTIGFGVEAHPNALLFASAMAATILIYQRLLFWRNLQLFAFLAGGFVYVIFYFLFWFMPLGSEWFALARHANMQDHPLPVLTYGIFEIFVGEIQRYKDYFFHKYLIVIALVFSIIFLTLREEKKDLFLLYYLLILFFFFSLFSANKDKVYLITIYPFFCILMSRTFCSLLEVRSGTWRSWLLKFIIVILLLANLSTIYHRITQNEDHDYDQLIAKIKTLIPERAKILALPSYWIGFNNQTFVSTYALTYYYFIHGNSVYEALQKIKPDIIIIDSFQRSNLVDKGYYGKTHIDQGKMFNLPKREFEAFLAEKTQLLGRIRDRFYGDIEIYKVSQ